LTIAGWRTEESKAEDMEPKAERLQKVLAAAGLASRRKAEELIAAGRVSVNGHVVTEPGTKADPRLDEIRVDGQLLRGPERHVYLAVYKPKGYMTTVSDPEGRPTVMDLLKGVEERVFPVGRLDYMSEGLLLLTNDGDLMAQLTRAGSHVAKTYMVKVSGKPTDEAIDKLRNGIMLPPEPGLTGARGKKQPGVERRSFAVRTRPAAIQLAVDQENPWFEVTLTEGRNRQLRRMFEQIGHHIEKIKRIRYGSLTLDLEPGEFRHLTPKEVNQLRKSLEVPFKPKPIKVKQKHARPERPERTPRLDAARFVKGRRGKIAAESETAAATAKPRRAAGGFEQSAAAPAFGRGSERRPFRAREERRPAGKFGTPRGPEFPRRERPEGRAAERDERYAATGPHTRPSSADLGGKRPVARKPRPGFALFERGAAARPDRRFSKGPGKPGVPSKPATGLLGRKPERGEIRPAEDFKRGKFKREEFRSGGRDRGEFEHKEKAAFGERGSRPREGFGSRPAGAASGKPGRGDFKRASGGGFKRAGGAKFQREGFKGKGPESRAPEDRALEGQRPKRPVKRTGFDRPSGGRFGRPSGGGTGRPSSPRRGGGAPRPPRRPERE